MWRVIPLIVLLSCTGAPPSQESSTTSGSDDRADLQTEAVVPDIVPDIVPDGRPSAPPKVVPAARALDLTVGRRVLVPGHGVGRVEGREQTQVQGVATPVVTLSLESQAIAIPAQSAHEIARELISPAEARALLSVLRAPGVPSPRVALEVRVARQKAVLARDNSADLAAFLRELYGMQGPLDDRDKVLILLVERDVLGEIAEVTGRDLPALRSEMRALYSGR